MDEGREQTPIAVGEAYISGALTALDDAPRTKLFYEVLAEIAEAAGLRAYLPHRVSDPVAAAHLDPRAVYEIDRAHVTGAAVVIAYAGIPSFGVGIEVELAREHAVPVIVVAERDRPISLRDDDDRHGVLSRELDLDTDPERGDAGVRDDDRGARDVRTVELVHSAWIEERRRDRIAHPMRQVRAQTRGLRDLREDFVEQL